MFAKDVHLPASDEIHRFGASALSQYYITLLEVLAYERRFYCLEGVFIHLTQEVGVSQQFTWFVARHGQIVAWGGF